MQRTLAVGGLVDPVGAEMVGPLSHRTMSLVRTNGGARAMPHVVGARDSRPDASTRRRCGGRSLVGGERRAMSPAGENERWSSCHAACGWGSPTRG